MALDVDVRRRPGRAHIYSGHIQHRQASLKIFIALSLVAALLVGVVDCASAITIQIDYSYDTNNFFDTQLKKDLLQDAADTLANRLTDQLTAIVPDGSNTWTERFFNPATGLEVFVVNPTVPANTVVVYAGGRDMGDTGLLGQGGNGGYINVSGTQSFNNAVATRGQGIVKNPGAVDFAPWGGSITFNMNATQNAQFGFFNQAPTNATYDFFSVAIHELSHMLGFGLANSWQNQVGNTTFLGPHVTAANGGVNPLLSGDKAHWQTGTQSDGRYAAMDAALFYNTRTGFTSLDFAGLADVGWTLAPLGIPGDVNNDGVVDIKDVTAAANHWLTPGPAGDANYDSIVDIKDITLMANHWLQVSGGGANVTAIPEPATIVTLAIGALIVAAVALRKSPKPAA